MELSLGVVIEIASNLLQAIYLVGFLFLFFENSRSRLFNIISYCIATLLYLMLNNYYTYHELTFNHSDSVFGIIILMIYSLICLKGNVILRIIMPIIDMLIDAMCGFGVFYLFSLFSKSPFVEALTFSNAYRYLFLIVVHATRLFVYWLVLRISKKRIRLNSIYEIVTFIVVPIVSLAAVYSVMIAYERTNLDSNILMYVLIIMIVLIINTVVFWIIVDKISKDNNIKTELLLSNQREEMYKTSVLEANDQIEKTSQIKHDMKNGLKSIQELIQSGQYEEAARLCSDESEMLSRVYTPVSTSNPTLNAIMNVELDKAYAAGIDFTYNISDTLAELTASEIVSIIGNLCDNAVEYLNTAEQVQKKMSLEISAKKGYKIIKCRNAITCSVLDENPSLSTTKGDKGMHGKGLNILREIAAKYNGELTVNENDGMIEISLILRI